MEGPPEFYTVPREHSKTGTHGAPRGGSKDEDLCLALAL